MTANKELQNLYDLRFSIKDLKAEFERNSLTKSRFGLLILTKLDEAYHWANDLVSEMEAKDEERRTLAKKLDEYTELYKQKFDTYPHDKKPVIKEENPLLVNKERNKKGDK
jgi:hypothetical protein